MSGLDLPAAELGFLYAVVFLAGIARGYTGFGASATIMALATWLIAPIDLLPICLLLEIAASLLLLRGSVGDADKALSVTLVAAAFLGVPVGLYLTRAMDPDHSRIVALALVGGLAALQLLRILLPVGQGRAGAVLAGLGAGVVNGLASIGGLVHALYLMARDLPARAMRGTMILIILFSGAVTLFWQVAMGIMTGQAMLRVAVLLVPFVLGLWLGRRHFTPENERHYRPVSLGLLVALAGVGLVRQII